MAGSGSIGTDAYTRMINDKLIQLDTRFAIDNQYTPLIGDYSGLRGGTRKQSHITPGISGTQYPLNYPESYAISAGVMRRGRPARPVSTISPVNSVYPSIMPLSNMSAGMMIPGGIHHSGMPVSTLVINPKSYMSASGRKKRLPMGRNPSTYTPKSQGGKRRSTKGMMSLTMPGLEDYTTKKSSMYHDIGGHYVKSLPRPYSGGLLSLKDIGRSISSGFKKVGSDITNTAKTVGSDITSTANKVVSGATNLGNQIASGATQDFNQIKADYQKSSPEFKMVARQVLPTLGSVVGSSLGAAAGTLIGPEGTFIGEQLGSVAGNQLGKYATRKIGLGRKKKPVLQPSKTIPVHPLQTVKYSKVSKRGGARKSTPRGDMIKKLMKDHGMTLGQASSYIKSNNLY